MRIAINDISYIKKLKGNEIIYAFDKETIDDLKKTNLHCIHKDYIKDVDINLTPYDIPCTKKCTLEEYLILPPKKDYKFVIIVPNCNNDHGAYKGKTFLKNCIESLLSQTYKNFELIIIDDMSEDNSVETIKSYKDKRIHLIQNKRKRYNGGSRNVGIEYALDNLDFDYFAFVDSDDWWKDDKVLGKINKKLYDHELITVGCEAIGEFYKCFNKATCYEDLYSLNGNVWCSAWSKVIRKDKIVYFCEDTLMEDRVWTYKLADNLSYENVTNLNEIVYCWNRTNVNNSVSIVLDDFWKACAYCHIGHQKQLLTQLKHKEMIPKIEQRIKECISLVNKGEYKQR